LQGLTAGVYVVYVTDANGCQGRWTITLTNPTLLVASATSTDITCYGAANGTASASATGGTAPYTYTWSNGATTAAITGLAAGNYTVTVKDSKGCTATASVVIVSPKAIVTTKTMQSPKCYNGNDGWICVTATGGTGNLSYSWNTGATTSCLYNLTAGVYVVYIRDANGCQGQWTITLTNPAPVVATMSFTNISCNNENNGTATAVGSGGSAPYTYTWNTGIKTATITGLKAGTYTVTVRDAKGCTKTGSVTITNPPVISAVKTMASPSCRNGNNGWICVQGSGGTGTLTYLWNTGATTSCIYNLTAGTYSVTITDSKGCCATWTITLTNPPAIVITEKICNVTYCNGSNGSICATATGGTGTLTYSWSTGATSSCIYNLKAGDYTVWVKDAKGCTKSKKITVCEPSWCTSNKLAGSENSESNEAPVSDAKLIFEAYPNPFVESSTVNFSSMTDAFVTVEVFNMNGEFVSNLFSGNIAANQMQTVRLNGAEMAQGVYVK
jgi:hypothetical protein